ncbi:MAG: ATP-dependent helicase [bacterium]|nr:ATP-dependent helicase [bacterium]
MSNSAYIGQAGTGKTTKIISKLESILDETLIHESSCILAITYMHGSRKRLEAKLHSIQKKGVKVKCVTIDAFCFNLVQIYKQFLGKSGSFVVSENPDTFTENIDENKITIGVNIIRKLALELLQIDVIRDVLKFSYPIIVVDEFQDCITEQLDVIISLSKNDCLLLAADDFQSLDDDLKCDAVDWLKAKVENEELDKIWRTDKPDILDTARALRLNEKCQNPIKIECVSSPSLAAWIISAHMQWSSDKFFEMGQNGRTVAILSPVGTSKDAFVRATVEKLKSPFTKHNLYPKPFIIDSEKRRTTKDILKLLIGFRKNGKVNLNQLDDWNKVEDVVVKLSISVARRRMSLRNVTMLSSQEFSEIVSSRLHFASNFLDKQRTTRIFLTIHGAKNREFDDVFILWPSYTIDKRKDVYLRKLMYNAVTRAKRKVILIVQDKDFNSKKGTTSKRFSEPPLNLLM